MKRPLFSSLVAALLFGAPAAMATPPTCEAPTPSAAQRATKVGEDVHRRFESAHPYASSPRTRSGPVHIDVITHPGAAYIAPHFERLELEEGDFVVVRAPDGSRSKRYDNRHPGARDGFWALHISGDTAIVELHAADNSARRGIANQHGYTIDRFARGYTNQEMGFLSEQGEALCGANDLRWAPCYKSSEPTLYGRARPVARLLIDGSSACTGWLVGSQGHVMTNEHCVGTASQAQNTDIEFMAEGESCTTNCGSWFGCPGTVYTGAALVKADYALDYSLLKLPESPIAHYGYLQVRDSGAVVNERIYIPQHPQAHGKQIAVLSTHASDESGYAEVYSLDERACHSGGPNDVGYYADTLGGSSGSPVIGHRDHLVVALHHCANCPNRGVPIQRVLQHLGANLVPPCARPAAGCPDTNPTSEPPSPNSIFEYTATNTNSAQQDTANRRITLGAGQSLTVATCGLSGAAYDGDTFLRLFRNGIEVAHNDDACAGRGSSITYTATTAGEYEVRAGCYGSGSCGGTVIWEVSGGAPPSPPTSGTFSFSATNTDHARRNTITRDIPLTQGQMLIVATCGMPGASYNGDTILRLFSGATPLTWNDDACNGRGSSTTYTATSTRSVQVRVGCYGNDSCSGNVSWRIQ
ncbi:trypsin-like peptidase domain-containing protein [Myxococcus fulvus]|uniref:trypsin-like peptidase domain-containing protein n=1 Tax=Myxococcus fulvus TaxID=33 RepID=UPI003B9D2283